jgi:hypothetical protein
LKMGQVAPDFTLPTIAGQSVSLSDAIQAECPIGILAPPGLTSVHRARGTVVPTARSVGAVECGGITGFL